MAESATSPRRIKAAERRREALQLRKAGATYEQIAQRLEFANKGAAHAAVKQELAALPKDDARDVLQLEIERLDAMFLAYWPHVAKGNARAGEIAIRIMERRSKLIGLDAVDSVQRGDGADDAKSMLGALSAGLAALHTAQQVSQPDAA